MSYSPKHSFKDGFVLKTFQYTEKWLTGCLAQNTEPQTPINSRWHCYAFQIATIFLKTREVYVSTQNGHKTMSNHKVIKVSEHSFSRTLVCSLKFSLMPERKCAISHALLIMTFEVLKGHSLNLLYAQETTTAQLRSHSCFPDHLVQM